jgi:hypothetical protein
LGFFIGVGRNRKKIHWEMESQAEVQSRVGSTDTLQGKVGILVGFFDVDFGFGGKR